MHFHIRTDNMNALGTFDSFGDAQVSAHNLTRNGEAGGYDAWQMQGGARAYECSCWMGEYVLDCRDERFTRSTNH